MALYVLQPGVHFINYTKIFFLPTIILNLVKFIFQSLKILSKSNFKFNLINKKQTVIKIISSFLF